MRADVVIAGGGVAGLACGAALAGAGLRVVLAERDERLGGRAASWTDPVTGDAVDLGPHVITSEHRNFLALLERLGTAERVGWQRQPLLTLLDHGRRLRMRAPRWIPPLHALPNLPAALRCVGPRDLLSNARAGWRLARLDEPRSLTLDHEDALAWLRHHGVTPRFVEWFWRPATLALLNVPLEGCSAAALARVFRLMLGRSGYCFGFPRVGLAELFAPACRARIEAAGGAVLSGSPVRELVLDGPRFTGVVLDEGGRIDAACGVLALPPEALGALWPGHGPEAPAWHGRFAPSPYVSTLLWFDRKLTRERFWARAWKRGDLNLDFYELANIRSADPSAPSLVASNAIHAHEAATWSDERIVEATWRELAEFAPAARGARLRHARVHRIPMAVPCPAPGTESLRPSAGTPWSGLWIAGDWTATGLPCSMESAARSAALAAEAVARSLGRELRLALAPPETSGLGGLLRPRRRGGASPLPPADPRTAPARGPS